MAASTRRAPSRPARHAGVLAAALLLLAAPSCDDPGQSSDDAGQSSGCTERDGCADPLEICIGPDEPLCGVEFEDACFGHDDCGEDGRCHAIAATCSDDGLSAECGPPCEPGAISGAFRCDADGAWAPLPCDEGYACGAYARCNPARAAHGCEPISCGSSTPCEVGVCVNGRCQSGPGRCQPPPA